MRHLFAYGTLMRSELFRQVAGVRRDGLPGVLNGYRRRAVLGARYPAIVADRGAEVMGLLYPKLPTSAWRSLDRYEGEMYQRLPVSVELVDERVVAAEAYVIRPAYRYRLASCDWDEYEYLRSAVCLERM